MTTEGFQLELKERIKTAGPEFLGALRRRMAGYGFDDAQRAAVEAAIDARFGQLNAAAVGVQRPRWAVPRSRMGAEW